MEVIAWKNIGFFSWNVHRVSITVAFPGHKFHASKQDHSTDRNHICMISVVFLKEFSTCPTPKVKTHLEEDEQNKETFFTAEFNNHSVRIQTKVAGCAPFVNVSIESKNFAYSQENVSFCGYRNFRHFHLSDIKISPMGPGQSPRRGQHASNLDNLIKFLVGTQT